MSTEWRIWSDRKAYTSFFDHDWAQRLGAIVAGTPYEEIFYQLAFQWKGTANASRLPHSVVSACSSFADGYINSDTPRPIRLINALESRVTFNVLPPLTLQQTIKIATNIRSLDAEMNNSYKDAAPSLDEDELWHNLLGESEFGLALLMLQRMCYSSLFFGYENFLVKALKQKSGRDSIRVGTNFGGIIDQILGQGSSQKYWTCKELEIPRLVRHALTHAGGDETVDLAKFDHEFEVIGGRVQITILDTRRLFITLSKSVELLLDSLMTK